MVRPRIINDTDILNRAMLLFWSQGYRNVSTRDLEQSTGLPTCSLNLRWGNKEGIFVAALKHYVNRIIDRRIERYLKNQDTIKGLRAFFQSPYQDLNRPYHACLVVNTWSELDKEIPAVTEVLNDAHERVRNAFRNCLAQGILQGDIQKDLDVDHTAEYLQMSFQGLLITIRAARKIEILNALVETILSSIEVQPKRKRIKKA